MSVSLFAVLAAVAAVAADPATAEMAAPEPTGDAPSADPQSATPTSDAPEAPASEAAPAVAVPDGTETPSVAAAPTKATAKPPAVELGGRVHGRYQYTYKDTPSSELKLVRARFLLDLNPKPWLAAQLELDAADVPAIKDAFVDAGPFPWLKLAVGQYKKPFSRVRLTSSGKLPVYDRGIVDQRFAGNYGYGGRDIGAMLHGELGVVSYALNVSNGTRSMAEVDAAKDLGVRFTVQPMKALELGLSGAMVARSASEVTAAWRSYAAAVDGRVKAGRLEAVVEATVAQEPLATNRRTQLGFVAWATYRTRRIFTVSARPIIKYELLDDDLSAGHDDAQSFLGGMNLHFDGPLRLLLQAERVMRERNSVEQPERRFVAQLAFDFKSGLGGLED